MTKVGINWTIDLDIVNQIDKEAKGIKGRSAAIANNYLRKAIQPRTTTGFFECLRCKKMAAPTKDGYCSECFRIIQEKKKELEQKEHQKLINDKIEKIKSGKAETDKEKKELETELKHIEEQFEDCLKNKKKWNKKYPKLSYKEHKELLENKIKRLKKELKELGRGEKEDGKK